MLTSPIPGYIYSVCNCYELDEPWINIKVAVNALPLSILPFKLYARRAHSLKIIVITEIKCDLIPCVFLLVYIVIFFLVLFVCSLVRWILSMCRVFMWIFVWTNASEIGIEIKRERERGRKNERHFTRSHLLCILREYVSMCELKYIEMCACDRP